MTPQGIETVGAPDDAVHARLCARLVSLLRESVGEDRRWPDDLGARTRLDADLALDSLETAAFAARVRQCYGGVDLLRYISELDIDTIIGLTMADVADHIAATPADSPSNGDAPTNAGADADPDTLGPAPRRALGPRRDRGGRPSRFLFVSLPLTGHVNPIAAVARELELHGHAVAWAGSEAFLRPLIGPGPTVYPIPLRAHRGGAERGLASTKSRWAGYIVPHARVTRAGIAGAIGDFRPDVLAVDQHAVAGAIEAHRAALPWATLAPTTMELTRPLRPFPAVERWIRDRLAEIWRAAGMPGEPPHDLRFSPHLVIAFTGAALVGDRGLPANAALVGPALTRRPSAADFPWRWLDENRRHVLVTVGTLAADMSAAFYRRVTDALRPLGDRLQAILVAPEGAVPDPPEHLLVRPRVPVLDLMPHLDAVVSHGGLNTVCEALAHGVPLVVAPIRGDQPINAEHVAAAGAGIRVRFDGIRPESLRGPLLTVLDDPSYRAAAGRVRESLREAGGAAAAAEHLELLALDTAAAELPAVAEI